MEEKKTVGKMLYETQTEHMKEQMEVGEFIEEIGKKEIMKEIWKQIDERKGLEEWKDKFYLLLHFKKNYQLQRVIEILVQSRHTRPKPEQGLSLYSYDPKEDALVLEWTIPEERAFITFLLNPDDFDPFLIECIKKYQAGTLE